MNDYINFSNITIKIIILYIYFIDSSVIFTG